MKSVRAFQTSDGVLHTEFDKAQKHAQKRYDAAMTDIHHALMREPYSLSHRDAFKAAQFIQANTARIAEAEALRIDWQSIQTEEDEE